MSSFSIRIFGSKDCEKCASLLKAFQYHDISYEYIDADAPENEELCDNNKVDELPHIQALYSNNRKVFHNHIGYVSPITFVERAIEHTKLLEEFFRINAEVANSKVITNEEIRKIDDKPRKPCNGCSKKNKS